MIDFSSFMLKVTIKVTSMEDDSTLTIVEVNFTMEVSSILKVDSSTLQVKSYAKKM